MSENKVKHDEPHSLQDQLVAQVDAMLKRKRDLGNDQTDVETAFAADKLWSGQRGRLIAKNPKGWDTPVEGTQ